MIDTGTVSATDEPPQLSELEQARWAAARSAIGGLAQSLADGRLDTEAVEATVGQLRQINVDLAKIRDAIHLPNDAAEFAGALTALLRRIPNGWGRWIDCEAGWYPILADLETTLSAVDPDYTVLQIKEKFGTLRFYCATEASDDDGRRRFDELVGRAEQNSAATCERCGAPGAIHSTASGWLKTLCAPCAEQIANAGGSAYRPIEPER
jgi:hypothetical protein